MDEQNVEREFELLAANAANESVGSIDFGVNAKAIALGDPELKKQVIALLTEGARLVSIQARAGYGSNAVEFEVRFRFKTKPSDTLVDVGEKSLLATVNIPGRKVRLGEVQKSASGFDAPFAIVAPLRDSSVDRLGQPPPDRQPIIDDFLDRIGLRELFDLLRKRNPDVAVFNTYWDTAYDTRNDVYCYVDTESDTTTRNNDHKTDYQTDRIRDEDDVQLDYKIDGKNDPEEGILIRTEPR